MKKVVPFMLTLAALPLLFVSAQDVQHPKAQLIRQKDERKAELKADLKKEMQSEVAGAPTDELNVNEFQLKRDELKGKVIELTFDRVISLKQTGSDYTAIVTYQQLHQIEGLNIIVPKEGLDLFQGMFTPGNIRTETVYVQVVSPSVVRALGTRYSEEKPKEKLYGW